MSRMIRAIVRFQMASNVRVASTIGRRQIDLTSETSTRVILCIDDDEAVLQYEKLLLEQFGHKVFTATSGREALQLADN